METQSGGSWSRSAGTVKTGKSSTAAVTQRTRPYSAKRTAAAFRARSSAPLVEAYDGTSEIFYTFAIYPNRDDTVRVLFGKCFTKQKGTSQSGKVWMHYCTKNPNSVSDHWLADDGWDLGQSAVNPTALGINESKDLGILPDCTLYDAWESASDSRYLMFEVHYRYTEIVHVVEKEEGPNGEIITTEYDNEVITEKAFDTYMTVPLHNWSRIEGSAPRISYDEAGNSVTVGTSMSGKRILEFCDTDLVSPTGITDPETLMNFYLSSILNLERYGDHRAYYYRAKELLHRWPKGRFSVSLVDTLRDGRSAEVSDGLDHAISEGNAVLNEFGRSFFRADSLGESADITVKYGTMESLWGTKCDGANFQGGSWEVGWNSNGDHFFARIGISKEARYYTTYAQVCFEEFYECLGCGYDQWEYPQNTTTSELGGAWMPDYMTDKDADMLRLVYSDAVSSGDDLTAVALAHNIPKGVKLVSDEESNTAKTLELDFLQPGHTYQIRAWIIRSDGRLSKVSPWITITIPKKIRPENWQWYSVIAPGEPIELSAKEWNDFTKRINEFREYRGLIPYASFYSASSGGYLYAYVINQAVYAIQPMNPDVPHSVPSGEIITASFFNRLKDALNAIL